MSDAQTVYRLGLALGCAAGAMWCKWLSSGVRDDIQTSGICERVSGDTSGSGVHRRVSDSGADPMKGRNEPATEDRSKVIDLFDYRCRRAWADYARRHGRAYRPDVRS